MALVLTQTLLGCAGPSKPGASPGQPQIELPSGFRQSQQVAAEQMPLQSWGQLFGAPRLDDLLARVQRVNPDIQQAVARTAQAEAAWRTVTAHSLPLLGAGLGASRQVGPLVNDAGAQGNLFALALDLQWTFDPLGRSDRAAQAARLDVMAARAAELALRIHRQVQLTQSYLEWHGATAELASIEVACDLGHQLVAAASGQVRAGLVTAASISIASHELRLDEQARVATLARIAHAEQSAAHLQADPSWQFLAADAVRPPERIEVPSVPPGLPAHLLARRADIAEAGFRVQAAQGRLDLTRDAWFPAFTLNVNAGLASNELTRWLKAGAAGGALGLLVQIPDLLGGRQVAERETADANLAVEVANYRVRVYGALREVEDMLIRQNQAGRRAASFADALANADQVARHALGRHDAGLATLTEVWRARRDVARAAHEHQAAVTDHQQAVLGLLHALGGGWSAVPGSIREHSTTLQAQQLR